MSRSDFWNSYASGFDAIYGTKKTAVEKIVNALFRKSMKLRFDKTVELIPAGATVIDVGCGPGHFDVALAKKGVSKIKALDFSTEMIAIAKSHATNEGVSELISFHEGDFLAFSADEKYDYCVMMGFIEYFEDPLTVVKKTLELTKKQVFISFPADGGLLAAQRKMRYKTKCFLKMYHKEELEKLFKGLPVKNVKIEKLSRDYFVSLTV